MCQFIDKVLNYLGFKEAKNAIKIRWKRRVPAPTPPQPAPAPVDPASPIEYVINDPTTPTLVKSVPVPTPPAAPVYAVTGYKGGGFKRGTMEAQAANVHVTIANTLNYLNSQSEVKLGRWPATTRLNVIPRAGVDLNAFYDRRSLQFFYYSKGLDSPVYTCDSADIVAHETGHGILDIIRPEMFNVSFLEVAAFHEFFGDFVALMNILTHDEAIQHALNETGGDLRRSSVVTRLAEQFGGVIAKFDPEGRNPACLRSAVNDFKYADPSSLPADAPDNKLAAESHNFSRVFLGAIWDIFVVFYEDGKVSGMTPTDAVKHARDTLCRYMMKAVRNAPINAHFFTSVAKTLLWCDVTLANRKYHDRMQAAFEARKIECVSKLMMLSVQKCDNDECIVRGGQVKTLKLSDHLIRAQSDNPLYEVELEVPQEEAHFYDNEKNLYGSVTVSEEDSLLAAQDSITYLHDAKLVSDQPSTPFEIRDGKLVRSHFVCGCCR